MDAGRLSSAMSALAGLLARLRGPGGCPWDAKQTDETIKTYLVEEAYEVVEAVETGTPSEVCQELGDLLFQILFLARLAEEKGTFDLVDVMERIHRKMVRRHPHVFGREQVSDAEEVVSNWQRIKKAERQAAGDSSSPLSGVPEALPALMRAHRIGERASKAGFDPVPPQEAWDDLEKAFERLRNAVSEKDRTGVQRHTGDVLFGLATLARQWGSNAENLLRNSVREFVDRFERTEKALSSLGIRLEEATREQMAEALKKTGGEVG
jgi:MazG family protein